MSSGTANERREGGRLRIDPSPPRVTRRRAQRDDRPTKNIGELADCENTGRNGRERPGFPSFLAVTGPLRPIFGYDLFAQEIRAGYDRYDLFAFSKSPGREHSVLPLAEGGSLLAGEIPPGGEPTAATATGPVSTPLEMEIPQRFAKLAAMRIPALSTPKQNPQGG